MKKIIPVFVLLLSALTAFSQTVTLTFTGRDASNQHLPMNRVAIANATQGWQETIYYPDTVFTMDGTGIADNAANGDFGLRQNNPNPFTGTTYATLQTMDAGEAILEMVDVNGRIVETQNFASLQPGTHQFRINVAAAGIYFLTARQNGQASSIKMVNNGQGATNRIEYQNFVDARNNNNSVETQNFASLPKNNAKTNAKGVATHPFALGDDMIYTGYVTVGGTEYQSQVIRQNQFVSEIFVLNFNVFSPMGFATVTTDAATNVGAFTATCGGNVTDDGGYSVIARGICWSTSPNPVFNDNHLSCGDSMGAFSGQLAGLDANTTYYVRAYAVNSVGTAYGEQVSFTTFGNGQPCPGAATVTDVDNNTYNTVRIGQQCWMKENLKTTHYADGTSIPLGSSSNTTTAYRYYPNNDSSNVSTYGYLYNWLAVMYNSASSDANPSGVQGICPTGWHVPSDAEWTQLTDYVSSQSEYVCGSNNTYIAKAFASTTGWSSSSNTCAVSNNLSANNATGFSAVPAGYYSDIYYSFGHLAYIWSATQYGSANAYCRDLGSAYAKVFRDYSTTDHGHSVRCLSDDGVSSETLPTVITNTITCMIENSATCGGNVTNDGGTSVIARGVCWSTSPNPTIADNHTTDGSGTGSFTSCITGLIETITYYVRAYATNSLGTAYGSQMVFTTVPVYLPIVTTDSVVNVTCSSATCDGNVIDDGGASVIARGVCWSTSQNPMVSDSHTTDGSGTGNFISSITGLTETTTYYVRAYATNEAGTSYGSQMSFTTMPVYLPIVTTDSVTNVTWSSATCGSNVTDDGGYSVTARGVCWSTSQNPTIADSHTTDGIGTGSYISSITGLTETITYYVRAYATNETGTSYGNQESFTTESMPCPGAATVSDYDNNTYNTVKIGNQCWMKENLRTTHYADGTFISLGSITSTTTAYRYCPNNSSSNVSTYGYLYNWKAVMRNSSYSSANPSGVQGICPTGWHVPSDSEWTQLADYVSSQSQYVCGSNNAYIAKSLASTIGWSNSSNPCVPGNNLSSNNVTGFSAVPAGYYGGYSSFGNSAHFWSATQYNSSYAYGRDLVFDDADVNGNVSNKYYGYSVRCVRD